MTRTRVPNSGHLVAVIGQGYVGLPVSMQAVKVGFSVVGFELSESKVHSLRAGRSYIDDVTDADIAAALATGRFVPSSDPDSLTGFTFAVITVPTPLALGTPDLSFIESAARTLAPYVSKGSTIILESTTYPGTTEELLVPLLESGSGLTAGTDFHVGFSPERIDPGNAVWNFATTPKVVSGIDAESLERVKWFYDQLVATTVPVKGTREAELTKLLENTFRHVNIALVNELAMHARALEVDVWDVIRAASSKPFGFMPFFPGPGVGGHCLPIDPSYLSWKVSQVTGNSFRFVDAANDINNHMPRYVAQRILLGLNARGKALHGASVLVLGVAYKKNSNDARETPATELIRSLLELGAVVAYHDPHVERYELDHSAERVNLTRERCASADVVVLVTDHDDVDYQMVLSESSYIFDSRNRLSGPNVEPL